MQTYIALLRGINVSGQKKVMMTDLLELMQKSGFKAVQTYIQSGNIIFKSDGNDTGQIQTQISKNIAKKFGFQVPVLVIAMLDFKEIVAKNPFDHPNDLKANSIYFVLLKNVPNQDLMKSLNQESYPNEEFRITPKSIYLKCKKGYGNSKCDNNFFERKLKVQATTRNYRTMMKLMQLSQK
ncbi:DUF1697 domain-containing protein [Costertonia aggregata]|uniref:DUF1697 domain-containing protein n=1 Tax=Costertonia aggregata TaxID=343403 RepID=A0A7H9AQL9_9FLAO|nr:DUF1697 domain-containing protein [Costertonia aggregata]QLG45748.1 DUF1697 domain-containing protein [Costertonia aggregata]